MLACFVGFFYHYQPYIINYSPVIWGYFNIYVRKIHKAATGQWLQCWERRLNINSASVLTENASRQHQHNRPFTTKPFAGLLSRWRSYRMSLPRSAASLSQPFQNYLRKPHWRFLSSRSTRCVFIKNNNKTWLIGKERGHESARPPSVCCLYTKQRVLEACARSILLAKRSDSSVPSQHI